MKLGIPVLNRYDLLENLLMSVREGTEQPEAILVVDNGHQPRRMQALKEKLSLRSLDVVYSGVNLGVAASWNRLLKEGVTVLSNDDVTLPANAFKELADALRAGHAFVGPNFEFFGQLPIVAQTIGYYDEAFFPAYYEDSDYTRRMRLAGFVRHDPKFSEPLVHKQWASSANTADLQAMINKNFQRYCAKWGGPPDHEVFLRPFDGARS